MLVSRTIGDLPTPTSVLMRPYFLALPSSKHVSGRMARFFRLELSSEEGRTDGQDWAAVRGRAEGLAGAAAASGGPGGRTCPDGAAECPRLHRAADRGDLRGRRGHRPHLAAPLPGARTRRAGGLSAAGQAAEGLPGPADRGRTDV